MKHSLCKQPIESYLIFHHHLHFYILCNSDKIHMTRSHHLYYKCSVQQSYLQSHYRVAITSTSRTFSSCKTKILLPASSDSRLSTPSPAPLSASYTPSRDPPGASLTPTPTLLLITDHSGCLCSLFLCFKFTRLSFQFTHKE